jgi:ABC-2 type transport system ATP-binding protein
LPAIVVEDLIKSYARGPGGLGGRTVALAGVSLTIEPGETVGIIGPNGAGKTTLLGCLLGFLRPDSGRIAIHGLPVDDLAVRAATGYLPERLVLDRWMSGRALLHFHHALAGLPRESRPRDCDALLDRVGLDREAASRRVGRYSRGMLQRLALAQALLGDPRLLYLDEPISGVDPAGIVVFRDILSKLSASGATILINSHQLAEVERVCHRVVFVKQGRVEAMETMRAGAAHARVLRVRLSTEQPAVSPERLAALAGGAGATFRGWSAPDARFGVADDAGATRLVAALAREGVALIEVMPEEGRLERLFASGAAGAATPEAAPRGSAPGPSIPAAAQGGVAPGPSAPAAPAGTPAPAPQDDHSRFMPPPGPPAEGPR